MKGQSLASKIGQHLGRNYILYTILVILVCLVVAGITWGFLRPKGWMTYRHDNARSGITTARLTTPLALRWTFQPTHAPQPAWSEPAEELERMHSDNVYHVTTAGGRVYFGSSVDNKVYALSAKTGKVQWTFFTEGPVRYAPTVWKGRIYIGSDDGYVYCLRAKNGRLIWKYRAGPSAEKVLGNGRMISLWPVRTSVLVDEGVVYFSAGVFPYEGLYICALDANDGTPIWKNDTVGDLEHEVVFGGISPQGYLVASENVLYVPSGRAMPAAFDRQSGQFLYYMFPPGKVGGTWALLDESSLVAGVDLSGTPAKVSYDELTGERKDDVHAWFPGIDLVVTPDFAYTLTEEGIYAIDRAEYLNISDKRDAIGKERRELQGRYSDLRTKLYYLRGELSDAEEKTRKELDKQRDDLMQRFNELAEEEERLKASICTWEYPNENLSSLILASKVVYAGGAGLVVAVDAVTGKELWTSRVEGKACGIAATSKELLISTDNGNIYCFAEGKVSAAKEVGPAITLSPFREDDLSPMYESAAEAIVRETGIRSGYCLVLGAGTGRLAFELAKRTELKIVGIEADQEKVEAAKKRLDEAGLYGSRVVVEPWELSTLPDYFANLIVSDKILTSGELEVSPEEMFRVLKPCGGIAYFGQPLEASNRVKSVELQNLLRWLGKSGAPEPEVAQENGIWAKVTRGKLAGAGSWTHQYGNPQNTACSGDQLVKGQLGVLWFGEPGPRKMVERHAKAASPVSINGRLFIQGEEVIMAYDAYNGTLLWERKIPGAVRARADVDGGNLALTEEALYVAAFDKCYRLDPATGETVRVYEIPAAPDGSSRRWGFVSCTGNTLYGSTAMPLKGEYAALWNDLVENGKWKKIDEIPSEYRMQYASYTATYPEPDEKARADFQRSGALWRYMADFPSWENYNSSKGAVTGNIMVSDKIFARDTETGKLLWTHHGKRIAHITVSIGDGRIFFAESAVSEERKKRSLEDRKALIRRGIYEEAEEAEVEYDDADIRMAVALDAATGRKLWEKSIDLTGCGGENMASIYHDGVLLFFGSVGNHDAWRFKEGTLRWKRIAALSARNGDILWSRPINYRTRPLVVGDKIIIEPRACDFRTGEIITRTHPITGKQVPWEFLRPGHTCAVTSASANTLFYRSYSTAMYDLAGDRGVIQFGAIRPGCWINMIPANGLLLFPEASSGCTCSFPLRTSVVLKPKPERAQPWAVFITHGALTPAKHFAINLGAPADMKDDEGTVWFGYPNPVTDYSGNHFPNYGVKFDLGDETPEGMGYFCSDFRGTTVDGSDKPWLFTSGFLGPFRCEVPLIDDAWGEEPGLYTVRLGFNAPSSDRVGKRVFDVMLQGDPLLKDFDILKDAGAPNRAVIKEFKGVKVNNILAIELASKKMNPTIAQAPIINFIQVLREDRVKTLEVPQPARPGKRSNVEALLKTAKAQLGAEDYEGALEVYHNALDVAPSADLKRQALEGMATIGSPQSLSRVARYCRDVSPILWQYKEPDRELVNCAARACIAIANNTAKTDKQKSIRMLNYALTIADSVIHKEVVASLENLGVNIEDDAAR